MSEKRRDNKKRILRTGESQRADGRYAYKYIGNDGKPHFAYSWKLEKTDSLPSGKRDCEALREQEKRIEKGLADDIVSCNSDLTVYELVKNYIAVTKNLKESTVETYKFSLNFLRQHPLSNKKISHVTVADAKSYAKYVSDTHSFGTTKTYLTVIKAAFSEAVEDEILSRNPFAFRLSNVVVDNTEEKRAISDEEALSLLEFCRNNKFAQKDLDALIILLGTGMRISELCGLTTSDIDMDSRIIYVRHQLRKVKNEIKLIEPKSKAGIRIIPMSNEVYEALNRIQENRKDAILPEYAHFLFLTRTGKPTGRKDWSQRFLSILKAINKDNKNAVSAFTPHLCRHTFCSNMALSGINLKVLQKIVGHSQFQITADRYVHIDEKEDIQKEFYKVVE